MADPAINTHTLYAHYARQLKLAEDNISNYGKYIDQALDGIPSTNLQKYIDNLKAAIANPKTDPAQIPTLKSKLASAEARYTDYKQKYDAALLDKPKYQEEMRKLEVANDTFLAPPEKQGEYLYVLDTETCKVLCDKQNAAQQSSSCICTFKDKASIELTGTQTDAVRIWNNGSRLTNLTITDNRIYNEAHRDAIQLIPPPMLDPSRKAADGTPFRLGDQMAGAILDGATVENCTITSRNGTLQGIFSSDGLLKNITILNNSITTQGYHFITFNGLLSGSIGGNLLQSTGQYIPKIYLNPARIGGNMADDGVLCLLSFAAGGITYEPITQTAPNPIILADRSSGGEAEIVDVRDKIPTEFEKFAIGLKNFRYQDYFNEYSNLTFGSYRTKYPTEYQNLVAWLTTRVAEYNPTSPRSADNPLGAPTAEQMNTIRPLLVTALNSAKGTAINSLRMPDLQETAIRSFVMKQLAIRYGEVQPLVDLGEKNARREAMLKFLLTTEQLQNLVNQSIENIIQITVWDITTDQPIPQGTAYQLTLDDYEDENGLPITYSGLVQAGGLIFMGGVLAGNYTLEVDSTCLQ